MKNVMNRSLFFAAFLCCIVNVQINAATYLYESNGIHYVLVASTFGDVTSRSACVVHPETVLEDEYVPTTPSSYTGAIVIPDTIPYEGNNFPVKFINDSAFHQSTITSIDLPATTTVFNTGAFKDCQALQTIICRAQTPPSTRIHSIAWDYEDVFGSLDPDQVSVYVPNGTVWEYQEAGGWDAFSHFYTIESMQGIEETNANANANAAKLLRDGQLLIIKNGKIYNAQGVILK